MEPGQCLCREGFSGENCNEGESVSQLKCNPKAQNFTVQLCRGQHVACNYFVQLFHARSMQDVA